MKESRRNLFPLRMGTALAQVPHSFFVLKLTLDTNSTAVGPHEVDEDVLLFSRGLWSARKEGGGVLIPWFLLSM